MEKFILALLSLFVWPVGIVLYFVERDKNSEDAKMYLILGIIGLVAFGGIAIGR
jgi:hypothetical protein